MLRKSVLVPYDDVRTQRSSVLELEHDERVDRFDAFELEDDVMGDRTNRSQSPKHDSRLKNARSVRPIVVPESKNVAPEAKNALSLNQQNEEVTQHVESVLKETLSPDTKRRFQPHEVDAMTSTTKVTVILASLHLPPRVPGRVGLVRSLRLTC